MSQRANRRYQVIVVGGGPVGLGLAIDLTQRGISCAVIERNAGLQDIPKGQLLTARTLEHFAKWGCVDEVRAARVLPPGHRIGSLTIHGTLFSRYRYASRGAAQLRPGLFAEAGERLPQYQTERVLRRRLTELDHAALILSTTVRRVEQDRDGVRVGVEPTDGGAGQLSADYVVGCDGARSLVRESVGIGLCGGERRRRMMLVVFHAPEFNRRLDELPPATTYRVLRPTLGGWWQFFGRIDAEGAFFFHSPMPDGAEVGPDVALAAMHAAAGIRFPAEITHVRSWDGRIVQAAVYRRGRVFIAGDAAHQHPPYGGYGLNTGLEDATNLGWKLAAALHGWCGDRLLDSYGAERMGVFAAVGALIGGSIERDRSFLERHDPGRDLADFETAWQRLANEPSVLDVQQEPHYEGSPIVCPPAGSSPAEPGIEVTDSLAARAGHHLSPRQLSTGGTAFVALGPEFTLIAIGADDGAAQRFADGAARLGVPLAILRDRVGGERAAWGARLILVRPDQYVAWSGDEEPADVEGVLARAVGVGDPSGSPRLLPGAVGLP